MGILSAFATSTTIADRQNQLTNVLDDTEPLAFAAGRIYTTLSVADAAAATAFIAGLNHRRCVSATNMPSTMRRWPSPTPPAVCRTHRWSSWWGESTHNSPSTPG